MRGNPENLRQAAARKSAAARTRSEHGLQEMLRQGQPVTFRGLAKTAGISLDFLYSTTDIRRRVEQLRAQQQASAPAATARSDADEPSSVVRTLTAQLAELKRRHRDEVSQLREALEVAHGENLQLRRRLGPQHAAGEETGWWDERGRPGPWPEDFDGSSSGWVIDGEPNERKPRNPGA